MGRRGRPTSALERKFKLVKRAKQWGEYLRLIVQLLRRPRNYRARELNSFRLKELYDNPYVRIERLDYLQCVTGIVSAPEVYRASQLAAELSNLRPVRIDLGGFDGLITTCPLNIKPRNINTVVQTIHDLIPLEYVAHNEDPLMFSHRLQSCLTGHRLFVSKSTANKFHGHIQNTNKKITQETSKPTNEYVITQPPSLRFPQWLTADLDNIADLRPVSYLLRSNEKPLSKEAKEKQMESRASVSNNEQLTPFRYFLFNSSVEARKNLSFLAKAYAESNLSQKGIKLCVTGKLKGDDYSNTLKEIVSHEPGIILTGYVDESDKLDLYLNALSLLSPSLVEGFGIPVLDGACLGMTTMASDCESHLEIQALHDFQKYVICLDTLNSREWASALQAVAGSEMYKADQATQERRQRIKRYFRLEGQFKEQLQSNLINLLS
jgi:glycosyltransferase involved in cell wall biosynthesis